MSAQSRHPLIWCPSGVDERGLCIDIVWMSGWLVLDSCTSLSSCVLALNKIFSYIKYPAQRRHRLSMSKGVCVFGRQKSHRLHPHASQQARMFYISFIFHTFFACRLHVLVTYFWTLLQWSFFYAERNCTAPWSVGSATLSIWILWVCVGEWVAFLWTLESIQVRSVFWMGFGRARETNNKRLGPVANAFYLQHVLCGCQILGLKVKSSASQHPKPFHRVKVK